MIDEQYHFDYHQAREKFIREAEKMFLGPDVGETFRKRDEYVDGRLAAWVELRELEER